MYHEVGTTFEFRGMKLRVYAIRGESCLGCALNGKDCLVPHMACTSRNRPDRRNVIFKRVK